MDDQTEFAAGIEFGGAKALTTDEGLPAVANYCARVQTLAGELLRIEIVLAADFSDNADFDAGFYAILKDAQHFFIGNFWIVDQQLFSRALQKITEDFTGVGRADDEGVHSGFVSGAGAIRAKKFSGFAHPGGIGGDNSEATAVVNIEMGEIEGEDVEDAAINNEKFIVVADQIVGGASDDDAVIEKASFELAQIIGSAAIDVSDERGNFHSARGGGVQSIFNVLAVGPKNSDVNASPRAFDGGKKRRDAIFRLDNKFHV